MLIIEGPDLIGKTTLGNHIESALNGAKLPGSNTSEISRLHLTKNEADWTIEEYKKAIKKATRANQASRHVKDKGFMPGLGPSCTTWQFAIQDRFHWSERIYGTVTRDGSCINRLVAEELDDVVVDAGGLLVVLTAAPKDYAEILEDRYRKADHGGLTRDQLMEVNEAYRAASPARYPRERLRNPRCGIMRPQLEIEMSVRISDPELQVAAAYVADAYISRVASLRGVDTA